MHLNHYQLLVQGEYKLFFKKNIILQKQNNIKGKSRQQDTCRYNKVQFPTDVFCKPIRLHAFFDQAFFISVLKNKWMVKCLQLVFSLLTGMHPWPLGILRK